MYQTFSDLDLSHSYQRQGSRKVLTLVFPVAGYIPSDKLRDSKYQNALLRHRHMTHRWRERDQADEHGWIDWFEGLASVTLLIDHRPHSLNFHGGRSIAVRSTCIVRR